MPHFVELWVYLSATPLFGLTATLVVYLFALAAYERLGKAPWANPVLWSVLVLSGTLTLAAVPYPTYFSGAQFIHFLLGPAVVALAWPLWERRQVLRRTWGRLALVSLAGALAAVGSALLLGWALGLPREVLLSLAPKSVTAPVAMGVAEKIGGVPALSAAFAVLTGLVGAMSGKYLYQLLRVPTTPLGWRARGFGLGAAAHGIGAARSLQVNAEAGAYAGLALGLQVVLQALLLPLAFRLFFSGG
ncbi:MULTISPECIES: LrgB family protein [Ramlibacter]|uniref:LrgB family protein n=1 Tax=Ramlibacter aquaticus TaxID=2780094 RepID=A0ABR9SHF7_9BURK|nr:MULTISPECIES: LrgB family protein [Ramlibacter]MBE7941788.1 LrgB family protein [Ramlibacter aquaticus]